MGIGGALIMPATLSILTNVFRDPRERGRAIAIWAGVSGLAVAVGPITGGLLLEHFSWSSVFWVNIPIGVTALILGAFVIPKSRDPKQTRLDPFGAILSIVGLATLLFGIIEGPEKGWSSDIVVASFVIAAIALIGFVRWEQHSTHPMLDMSVFRNPRFSSASSTITLTFFALFGSMFLMTQYWQLVHGYSPLEAGLRLVPHALTMMIVAPLSARFVERLGTKRIVTAGLSLIAIGLVALSTILATSPYPVVISYFLVMSVGMGMTMAPATESVMGSLPRAKAGVGSAVNDTTRQVGGALGVAIIGTVVSSVYAGDIADARPALRARRQQPRDRRIVARRSATHRTVARRAVRRIRLSAANDGFVALAQHRPADRGRDHRVRSSDGLAVPALARLTSGRCVDERPDPRRRPDRGGRRLSTSTTLVAVDDTATDANSSVDGPEHPPSGPSTFDRSRSGDPDGDDRPGVRSRHHRDVDGRRRPARRRVEGDDLPPLVLEGGTRPRRPAQCHAAVRRCRHGHAQWRPRPVRRRADPPFRNNGPMNDVLPHLIEVSCHDEKIRSSLDDYIRVRRVPLRTILTRAIERGELPSETDVDVTIDMLIGAFVYRRLLSHDTIDEHFAARLRAIVFPQPS